jgi:hypothetical protein
MSVFPNTCNPRGSPVFHGAEAPTGLPVLGPNESLFHASFYVLAEGNVHIEGVVAACNPQQAGSRLLAAEADLRQVSYDELFRASSFPEARRISREEALELVPRASAVMVLLPAQSAVARAKPAA